MENEPPPNPDQPKNPKSLLGRREAIALGGGAAALAAIALASRNKSRVISASRTDHLQNNVNQHYVNIYNALKQAKAKAESEKKPLAILVAEYHYNRDDLLMNFMVMDAARRLGIQQLFFETGDTGLSNLQRTNNATMDKVKADSKKHNEDNFQQQVNCGMWVPKILQGFRLIDNATQQPTTYDNCYLVMGVARLMEMTPLAGDPRHDLVIKRLANKGPIIEKDEIIREDAMNPKLLARKGSYVGIFGGVHVPVLADFLKSNGVQVCVISGLGNNERFVDSRGNIKFSTGSPDDDFVLPRLRALKERTDVNVIIEGKEVPVGAAYARMVAASLAHQASLGKIPPADAQRAINTILLSTQQQPSR